MRDYFGEYAKFETVSKKDAAQLLGADNLIGDVYDVQIEFVDNVQRAWLVSRFDKRIGYFDAGFSRELSVMIAEGMQCKAILSYVAFTDHPDEGHYWGEAAVICFNPAKADVFEKFIGNVSKKIGDDVRPVLELNTSNVQNILDSDGEWLPTQTRPLPQKQKGVAILKQRRSILDKTIEQGRAGNKGCYIASWVILLGIVTLIVWWLV